MRPAVRASQMLPITYAKPFTLPNSPQLYRRGMGLPTASSERFFPSWAGPPCVLMELQHISIA